MALIVQKYGGTSVANVERIKGVAMRIKRVYEGGNEVVVVVSARAGVTNALIGRARAVCEEPSGRELDVLLASGEQETIALVAMALKGMGVPAVSRNGVEVGIVTDETHGRARIVDVEGGDIKERLAEGKVVVVAGFQGISEEGEMTTLGRGGSDLTAIALGAALGADLCQIFTDVDGVHTTDPKMVPEAIKVEEISYEEMVELTAGGARVVQPRAVVFAQKHGVAFEVRSSLKSETGTVVGTRCSFIEGPIVRGVAVDIRQSRVVVKGMEGGSKMVSKIFEALESGNVLIDMIVQNVSEGGKLEIMFTVEHWEVAKAVELVEGVLGNRGEVESSQMAILSVVGAGMRSHSGIAAKLLKVLTEEGIEIEAMMTSEIRISCGIKMSEAERAVNLVHDTFIVHEPEAALV